jgi:hypothetical protein
LLSGSGNQIFYASDTIGEGIFGVYVEMNKARAHLRYLT